MGQSITARVSSYRQRKKAAGLCIEGGCWQPTSVMLRCVPCSEKHAARQGNWRERHPEAPRPPRKMTPENVKKRACRWLTQTLVQLGELKRLPCERCGAEKSHAHHTDYSKPKDVVWLCSRCHAVEHRRLRDAAKALEPAPVR